MQMDASTRGVAKDFNHKFIGYVEVRQLRLVSGWALDTRVDAPPPHVALIDGREVLQVAAVQGERADVAGRMGHRKAYHFELSIPVHHHRRPVGSISVALLDGATAARLSALCVRRDHSLRGEPVLLDDETAGNRDAFQILPDTLNLINDRSNAESEYREFQELPDNSLLIEITDLVSYLRSHNTVTGIQRTVCGLIDALLRVDGEKYRPFYFCALAVESGYVHIFTEDNIRELVDTIFGGKATVSQISKRIDQAYGNGGIYRVRASDILFISGAYWIVPDFDRKIAALKKSGAIVGAYIYDIIPITTPQWVMTSTNREVLESAFGVFSLSDFFITISDYVKKDLGRLLKAELDFNKAIAVAPLPHEIPGGQAYQAAELSSTESANDNPYVLCVCTLEGRKNHMLLYRIWAGLLRKYGPDKVPDLICVGKWGWRIDDFRENCERSGYLGGKIIVRSGVQDEELSMLFRGCMFTVFPSFVEGWGLPVGESLYFKKFCVASNAASIPEVGGNFVEYFDPHNYDEAFGAIERAIYDDYYLAERTRDIVEGFKARTWGELADTLTEAARQLASEARTRGAAERSNNAFPPVLEPSKLWLFEGLTTSQSIPWRDKQARFALTSDWDAVEPWGAWSRQPRAALTFRVTSASKTRIKIWLLLKLPNTPRGEEIAVISGDSTSILKRNTVTEHPRWVEIETDVPSDQIVVLEIARPKAFAKDEGWRQIYVGICGLGYCDDVDLEGQLIILKSMAMVAQSVQASTNEVR